MAQKIYKIALDNPSTPMLSEQQSRTIIGATIGESPANADKPGIAYMHNVMPTVAGLDSVGYKLVIRNNSSTAGSDFLDVKVIYGSLKTRLHIAFDADGRYYILIGVAGNLVWLSGFIRIAPGTTYEANTVTIGTVDGVSYIFSVGAGCYKWDEVLGTLVSVTLTGLTIADILGVVASSGYLIAYTSEAIAWSSTVDPTDFAPSDITGAGGGNVADTAGSIVFATDNSLGILLYTDANIIAGTYTSNSRFPFKFREVDNSKGGIDLDKVAYEANSSNQYVYSKAGLHSVTSQKSEVILPDITDFLAGKRIEDYDELTNALSVAELAAGETLKKKVRLIASRYMIISYGLPSTGFTHALVFDIELKKLGKLKIEHKDVFEYIADQDEISKESIAFLTTGGKVYVLDFSVNTTSTGVVILGKMQASRSRMTDLHSIEIENIHTDSDLVVYNRSSLTGKVADTIDATGFLAYTEEGLREYAFRSSARTHSLIFIGQFNLTSVQITYNITGRR